VAPDEHLEAAGRAEAPAAVVVETLRLDEDRGRGRRGSPGRRECASEDYDREDGGEDERERTEREGHGENLRVPVIVPVCVLFAAASPPLERRKSAALRHR